MNFDHNPIPEAIGLVSLFKKRLGDSPEVEGLCPKEDSCDICRAARKASKLYMAYVYVGWDIDDITRLCDTYSDGESRISGKDGDAQQERLHKNFLELLGHIRQKINKSLKEYQYLVEDEKFLKDCKSLKEYQYLVEDEKFLKDCKIAVKGLLNDVERFCEAGLLSTATVESHQTIISCRALILSNNVDLECKNILKALIQDIQYLLEDGTLSQDRFPETYINFSQSIIYKHNDLLELRKQRLNPLTH